MIQNKRQNQGTLKVFWDRRKEKLKRKLNYQKLV